MPGGKAKRRASWQCRARQCKARYPTVAVDFRIQCETQSNGVDMRALDKRLPVARLLLGLLGLICVFAASAASTTSAAQPQDPYAVLQPDKHRHGLLWKIGRPGVRPSYVFGTMHVEDPRVTHLAAPVASAFESAKRICTEVKLDYVALAAEMQAMFFSDGRTLRAVAGEPLYQRAVSAAREHGLAEAMVMFMKPLTLAYMLSMPPQQTGEFLDLILYTRAVRENKETCGLEQAEEHAAVLGNLPMADQLSILRTTLDQLPQIGNMYEPLLNAYLQHDLGKLIDVARSYPWSGGVDRNARFLNELVIKRNRRMVERMQPYLKQGDTFVAVGALHLPGKVGILQLLERQGWRVTSVW